MTEQQEKDFLRNLERIAQYLQGIGEVLNAILRELKEQRQNQRS
jgi:hypothetical protein